MDIMELSRKMEANLLETRTIHPLKTYPSDTDYSPRLTRSRSTSRYIPITSQKPDKEEEIAKKKRNKVDEVEKIYLNKNLKVVHKNLETIYEDPIWKKGHTMFLGTAKVKRSIYLDREFRIISKQKSKLRKMKIKRLGKKVKRFKMSDDEFKYKMLRIENYINGEDIENISDNQDCTDFVESEEFNYLESKSSTETSKSKKSNGDDNKEMKIDDISFIRAF